MFVGVYGAGIYAFGYLLFLLLFSKAYKYTYAYIWTYKVVIVFLHTVFDFLI